MNSETKSYLEEVRDACIECGLCTAFQREMGQEPLTFGEIARKLLYADAVAQGEGRVLKGKDMPEDVYGFARACLMCGRCTAHCPVDIRAPKVVAAARAVIAEAMPRTTADYRRYRCDRADSMYRRIRTAQNDLYPVECEGLCFDVMRAPTTLNDATLPDGDALAGGPGARTGETLFFPGCSLANNFPALSGRVFDGLEDAGLADCQTSLCCGRPLFLSGLVEDWHSYERELCDRIVASGARRVVTSCPNCYYTLRESFERCGIAGKVELVYLAELLAEAGYRFEPSERFPYQKVSIHDSCPDRHDGVIARSLRTIFENVEVVEPANSQLDSVCCGSGGFGSVFASELPQAMFGRGVTEFYETRARCMVTSCATCAAAYKSSGALMCRHYLELLFGEEMDMDAYDAVFGKLWDPSDADYLGTFEDEEPFFA